MRWLLLLLTLCSTLALAAGQVYRIVHPDGSVEYTDQPREGAEPVTLPEAQAIPSLRRPARDAAKADPEPAAEAEIKKGYSRLAITAPKDQATLRNIGGQLLVRLAIEPELREGDRVVVRLDGEPVAAGRERQYLLQNVYRGTHTLQAHIEEAEGRVARKAAPITIHVHQTSRLINPPSGE